MTVSFRKQCTSSLHKDLGIQIIIPAEIYNRYFLATMVQGRRISRLYVT